MASPEGDVVHWDLFCTVVDNFGDIGICWRLARQLSNEFGAEVRLWVDNVERFACLCPEVSSSADRQIVEGIDIRRWSPSFPFVESADVVIEAFACQLPQTYVDAMAARMTTPVWINLEYLSAEDWVEGCHLLGSPQSRTSLKKTFFFPGFTQKTGGLLRERGLLDQRSQFDPPATAEFWSELGIENLAVRDNEELIVSLFCYRNPALPELLQIWSESAKPIRLLATAGHAADQVGEWLGEELQPNVKLQKNSLSIQALPFLSQALYDRLLWACDLNFVRGEDSIVRALWAQRPFVWQIYPQSENAHQVKLDAFLSRYLDKFETAEPVRRFFQAWNGIGELRTAWQDFEATLSGLEQHGKVWVSELDQLGNLADNLVRFVCGGHFTG